MSTSRDPLRVFTLCALALVAALLPSVAQTPDPADLRRCQQRIEISGAALVERYFDLFGSCTGAVLECVQEHPDEDACLSAARVSCQDALGWTATIGSGPVETFVDQVGSECSVVDEQYLFSEEGLAHETLSCTAYGDEEASTLDELMGCVGRHHLCRALQLLSTQVPRVRELLTTGGVELAPLGCLTSWEENKQSGVLSRSDHQRVFGDNKRLRRSRRAAEAVTDCQATLTWSGMDYARDYLKHMRPCLTAARQCLGEAPEDTECQQAAKQVCQVQMEKIRTGERSLEVSFPASITQGCEPSGEPGEEQMPLLSDLLDPAGLGFARIGERCASLGRGSTDSLEELAECLLADHSCRLEQIVLRENPRARELLIIGGIDPDQFPCLKPDVSVSCGNGMLEDYEECDPPGSTGACGDGSRCSLSCECAPSGPPLITVTPLDSSLVEGQELILEVRGTDPDGEPVALSAYPPIEGATFVATSGTEATGLFTFTPDHSQQGNYAVTFTARDPWGLTDQATATIGVDNLNQAPSLNVQSTALVDEGELLTVPVTGSDPDGDLLTFTAAPVPENAIFIPATGTLTFTPDFQQSGSYSITFDVTDGTLWAGPQTLLITVQDVPTGGEGEPSELILELDTVESPTLIKTQKLTGRINPTGNEPEPARLTSSLIIGVSPVTGRQGETLAVQLTGESAGDHATHFVDGLSQAAFGSGVLVLETDITNASAATITLAINQDAAPGTRQIIVTTADEVAVSVLGFNILAGHAQLRARLVEADTSEPISTAQVTFSGGAFETSPGADGVFAFTDLPRGPGQLVINAQDHDLLLLPLDLPVGQTTELGDISLVRNVYDPSAPAAASLHSVLGRGVADLTGRLTVAQAKELIRDTIMLVGGNEAGVLDAYGNQLNPAVQGAGLMSLGNKGVDLYADRISKGESISLIELLAGMSFAFDWEGAPPRLEQFLSGLQQIVDEAWSHPNDPLSAAAIVIFNPDGKRLSPNPPVIDGNTTLNRFQAYLAVGGFTGSVAKRLDPSLKSQGASSKDEGDSGYTFTWDELLNNFGSSPSGVSSSSATGTSTELADYEELLRNYYLDTSDDTLEALKAILLEEFPDYGLEEHFKENPYGVKEAYDNLLLISEHDAELREQLISQVQTGDAGSVNLWNTMKVQDGSGFDHLHENYAFVSDEAKLHLISSSWAPSTPVIYLARETVQDLGSADKPLRVPAARVVFYRSGDDHGDSNPPNVDFHYRLWRIQRKGFEGVDPTAERPNQDWSQLVMVGFGKIEEPPADGRAPRSADPTIVPSGLPHSSRMAEFLITLPPAGMNYYRIDVIRRRGNGTPMGELDPTSDDFQNRMRPWLAGYLDDPLAFDPVGGVGRQNIHPGQGYLNSYQYEISPLSNAAAVYIAGVGNIGRADLAADYNDSSKVYVSVPGFVFDEQSRGTGAVFRYDAPNEELIQHVLPGFLSPGQAGLAIDNNFNLYTINAASEPAFGGKVFRYLGYRGPDDPVYQPEFYLNASGEAGGKLHVGQVNYYSRLISRAAPSSVAQITMGPALTNNQGPELYIAERLKNEIKHLPIQAPETLGWDSWYNSAGLWSSNSIGRTDTENALHFDGLTDIDFSIKNPRLYITQGSRVVRASRGVDTSISITQGGTIFSRSSGVAVCESRQEDVIFVADQGEPGTLNGVIYRIPEGDIPILIPKNDPQAKNDIMSSYLFLASLDHPTQVRVSNGGNALVFADAKGVRFKHLGFTGRALDPGGSPMVGAVVTIKTSAGTQSFETDSNGYYHFTGQTSSSESVVYATITHPLHNYFERVTLVGRCNSNTRPTPCVSITSPPDGHRTTSETVIVEGQVHPKDVDYSQVRGHLDVTHDSVVTSYDLQWTGNTNDFRVPGVSLGPGRNTLVVWLDRVGDMGNGSSLATDIVRSPAVSTTQAISGVVTNDEYRPRQGVKVEFFISGEKVGETITDECGYYNKQDLPLGEVSIVVEEE